MKCPYCGYQSEEYIINCTNCNAKIEQQDYLNSIIDKFNKQYENTNPSNSESGEIYYENINTADNKKSSKDYINNMISPEQFAINYYKKKGFSAFFAENDYWFLLFLLIYYENNLWGHDLYLTLLWGRNSNTEFDINNANNKDYEDISKINIKHIITTYFDRLNSLYDFKEVNDIFNNGKTVSIFDNYSSYYLFPIDKLLSSINHLKIEQLKLIFERIGKDLKYYSKGLPDLIVYNDKEFFFVEIKSKDDKLSLKQIQWLKFLSKIVKIKVIILTIDKSEKQIENIKKQINNSNITRTENNYIKTNFHSDKILLNPKIDYFKYSGDNKEYIFINYTINHSSGKGKPKQYLKTCIKTYNNKTKKWEPENENIQFFNLMKNYNMINSNVIKNWEKITHLRPKDFENTKEFRKYRKKISVIQDNIIYEKARKIYSPNVFADFRPTKKQHERNKKAKLLEEMNDFNGAIKLYELNVSEKTGSPTTYKRLCSIYEKFEDFFRINEVVDIAIPIFIQLNDKKNTLYFLKLKLKILRKIRIMIQRENGHVSNYFKFVSKEKNDYLYENCCIDNAERIIDEEIEKLKSNAQVGYLCSR